MSLCSNFITEAEQARAKSHEFQIWSVFALVSVSKHELKLQLQATSGNKLNKGVIGCAFVFFAAWGCDCFAFLTVSLLTQREQRSRTTDYEWARKIVKNSSFVRSQDRFIFTSELEDNRREECWKKNSCVMEKCVNQTFDVS